ncbi:rho GTPase-activating protein 23-like isoform X1 [Synchiropus splendidus]|uniref:rho GTPase-activating protein 23-like isoform X1 n=1 Tax=Synchiropus splendidus TaxID=270530 RepID=UPI00237E85AA|nr:rho GTPase-activating protein 23-like isoform X1 [Synchiropus splendidus]
MKTMSFGGISKDGWLNYKQIFTEKGKKVCSGIRPWKQVFSVLRSNSLFLFKNKNKAVLPATAAYQDDYPSINIGGCLIDIAYSETKRKHTLRLTTHDFCEYLLQAQNRDDMLSWITNIRENSKIDNGEIGFTRQSLIKKKLSDRKRSPVGRSPASPSRTLLQDKAVNRPPRGGRKAVWGIMNKRKKAKGVEVLGVRLEDCQPAVNHKFVPLIVEMCCSAVEAKGLEYIGIYRIPGNNVMLSKLLQHLSKGLDISTAEARCRDLNVISSLLKTFFRKLPEPLLTDEKYGDFIEASRITDSEDKLKTMNKLVHDLPDHHYHTLKYLVGHLKRVADNSEKNKMNSRNLALVFGPTLVRDSLDNMTEMITHMTNQYKIVETMILHYNQIFS